MSQGGGLFIHGLTDHDYQQSKLTIIRTVFKHNKQLTGSLQGDGGGGMYIHRNVIISIQACTFVKNEAIGGGSNYDRQEFWKYSIDHTGHTNFTNIETENNFYGVNSQVNTDSEGNYVTPKTCNENPCTLFPFAGTCSSRTDTKYGVLCGYYDVCPAGSYNQYPAAPTTNAILPPSPTIPPPNICGASKPEWSCTVPQTLGVLSRNQDCQMADEVALTNSLSITGSESTYTTLVAASGKRHFKIDSGAYTLTLTWLNMTGGGFQIEAHGGSIYINNVGSHLNITHCVFYKNSVGSSKDGGAIYTNNNNVLISLTNTKFIKNSAGSEGGAVYLSSGTLNSHNVQYIQNNAGYGGGGLILAFVKASTINNDLFTLNEAVNQGRGIRIVGNTGTSSQSNITRTIFKYNKQTGNNAQYGGGGLFIQNNVIISIRECTFIENAAGYNRGHQIMTYESSSHGTPSITLINTNFTNIDETENNFYGFDEDASEPKGGTDKYIAPNNCTANPCTVFPYTGTCSVRTNSTYGVLCGCNCIGSTKLVSKSQLLHSVRMGHTIHQF